MVHRRAFLGGRGLLASIRPAETCGATRASVGSSDTSESQLVFLEHGLRHLGHTPGAGIVIARRYADGHAEPLPRLAAELVRVRVDVLVAHGDAALAAKNATATIPVMFVAHPDPVGSGVVASLARPGANVPGLSDLHSELVAKRLEIIKAAVPLASRVAVLRTSAPEMELQLKDIRAAAPALGLTILPIEAKSAEGIDRALSTVAKARPDALSVLGTPLFGMNRRRIAAR